MKNILPIATVFILATMPAHATDPVFQVNDTANAVNGVAITGAATTQAPTISSYGSDTNVGLNINTQGTGVVNIGNSVSVNGVLNAYSLMVDSVPLPTAPSGRLSLSSTSPVMNADVTAATTIYYLPYVGQNVPVYDGTYWTEKDIGSSGLSLTLNSTDMPTSEVFDVYVSNQSSTPTLCALYWGGNTARSATAGGKSGSQDARIMQQNGIWVNKTAIAASNCYNGSTAYTIAAGQGTLLGSFYSSVAGQTEWVCHPAPASGGGAVDMAVYNTYNQKTYGCQNIDSVGGYVYLTANKPRIMDNSAANEDHWLDGLGLSYISMAVNQNANVSNTSTYGLTSMALDSTTSSGQFGSTGVFGFNGSATAGAGTNVAQGILEPQLGFHFASPLESNNTTNNITFCTSGAFAGFLPEYCGSILTVYGM